MTEPPRTTPKRCWQSSIYRLFNHTTIITLIIAIANVDALASHQTQQQNSNENPAIIAPNFGRQNQPANWHEPRIELRYNSRNRFVSLDERSPNKTVVAIVFVSDEDSGSGGETDLAIEGGNELGHFRLVVTALSNTIQVNGAPLSRHSIPEYNLTLVARDRGTPSRMSAVTLAIKLTSSSSAQLPLDPLPAFRPPLVSELIYAGTMLVILFSASVFFIIIGCALVQKPRGKKPPLPTNTNNTTSTTTVAHTNHHQTSSTTNWNSSLDFYQL